MLRRLFVADKTISLYLTVTHHFISKVVGGRFCIGREVLANGPRVRPFLDNFLLRMRRNGHNSTSDPVFNTEVEILMDYFLFDYAFWWRRN